MKVLGFRPTQEQYDKLMAIKKDGQDMSDLLREVFDRGLKIVPMPKVKTVAPQQLAVGHPPASGCVKICDMEHCSHSYNGKCMVVEWRSYCEYDEAEWLALPETEL